MEVLDLDGEKIGIMGERLGDYFNVDAGFLGIKECYVPFSAIGQIVDDNVILNNARPSSSRRATPVLIWFRIRRIRRTCKQHL